MLVAVAVYEIHIPQARSLKDKRAVIRSLRDRIRSKWEVSAAEVGHQDLHQRARLGVAAIASTGANLEPILEKIADTIDASGEAMLTGWNFELIDFGQDGPLTGPDGGHDEENA